MEEYIAEITIGIILMIMTAGVTWFITINNERKARHRQNMQKLNEFASRAVTDSDINEDKDLQDKFHEINSMLKTDYDIALQNNNTSNITKQIFLLGSVLTVKHMKK